MKRKRRKVGPSEEDDDDPWAGSRMPINMGLPIDKELPDARPESYRATTAPKAGGENGREDSCF